MFDTPPILLPHGARGPADMRVSARPRAATSFRLPLPRSSRPRIALQSAQKIVTQLIERLAVYGSGINQDTTPSPVQSLHSPKAQPRASADDQKAQLADDPPAEPFLVGRGLAMIVQQEEPINQLAETPFQPRRPFRSC